MIASPNFLPEDSGVSSCMYLCLSLYLYVCSVLLYVAYCGSQPSPQTSTTGRNTTKEFKNENK